MSVFRFRQFSVKNEAAAMKVGTDGVLLGAAAGISGGERRILDVGTGTGLIALMLAQRCPCAEITAIDIDSGAAAEATGNFAISPWADRLGAECTALSAFKPASKFDLIISNPPYYDLSLRNPDRRAALARHSESLSYRELCDFASEHLSPEGRLSMILPAAVGRDLLRAAVSFGLYPLRIIKIRTVPTKPVSRIIAEFSPAGSGSQAEEEELVLLLRDGSKSPEYEALTKEFYL